MSSPNPMPLVLQPGEEYILLDALSLLRKEKEKAFQTSQSLPQFSGLTERDFGLHMLKALEQRISGEPLDPEAPKIEEALAARAGAHTVTPATPAQTDAPTYSSAQRSVEVEAPGELTAVWSLNPGLSDRWGDIVENLAGTEADTLRGDSALHTRLREQMWQEMTFIAIKDGQYGVVFESEFAVVGDDVHEDDGQLVEREVMLAALRKQAVALAAQFPSVQLCLIPEGEACNGRPGLWAWVKDGALDAEQRAALGNAMLDPTIFLEDDATPRMGMR